jgi:hypothetical protein
MEYDFGIDVSEVLSVVNNAEVFVVMFASFRGRRLLVDSRTAGNEGPMIRVVNQVRNAEERFRDLRRMRPRFPAPERIVAFEWPRSVRTLVEAGVWQAIEDRVRSLGGAEATCRAVLAELQQEERHEERKAVLGEEPYKSLWPGAAAS